jgi:hypothetical protein
MSTIGSTIFNALKDITAIQGGGVSKVFPMERPQKTLLPAITYGVVSIVPVKQQTAVAQAQQVRVQITIYALTYSECESIGSSVRSILDMNGFVNTSAYGLTIQTSSFDSERDDYITNADYDGIFVKYQDYLLYINR